MCQRPQPVLEQERQPEPVLEQEQRPEPVLEQERQPEQRRRQFPLQQHYIVFHLQ